MSYHQLDLKSAITYIRSIPTLCHFLGETNYSIQEIGDGNLNLIFLVKSSQNQLIMKQALPYLRCVGKDYPLAKERMHYEIAALSQFSMLTPEHIPVIYHVDQSMCLVAMQYLDQHIIMRQGMIQGIYYSKFADHISTFLAENLFKTSSLYLSSVEKNSLVSQFNTNELRQLTENFVFSFPYMQHPTNHIRPGMQQTAEALWRDLAFKKQLLVLKDLFMNKTDALLHGDLHTGSIMLNQDETYVIDPEFAYMGPFGFEIGALLANLVMSWISHIITGANADYATWILTTIQEMMQQFAQKFLALWNRNLDSALLIKDFLHESEMTLYQQQFMQNILQESIGFAGCEIARRQFGIAGVQDIRGIQDEAQAIRAEKMAVNIAREFVVNHRRYQDLQEFMKILSFYVTQVDDL